MFREFDRLVGLDRLKAFHLNDSKRPCGSRVDRHEHIGKGCLGLEPFRRILTDPRFTGLPMLLETPKLDTPESRRRSDVDPWDARNLRTLRRLMRK
jgi:deoxyribonuclease-4